MGISDQITTFTPFQAGTVMFACRRISPMLSEFPREVSMLRFVRLVICFIILLLRANIF